MKIEIRISNDFERDFKRLKKRYLSLSSDLELLKSELTKNPNLGQDLGKGIRKIRLIIKSKGRGKSGGARIITYNTILLKISTHRIVFLKMYDKSEKDSITDKDIIKLLKKNEIIST